MDRVEIVFEDGQAVVLEKDQHYRAFIAALVELVKEAENTPEPEAC